MHSGFPGKIQKWPNLAKNWPKLAVSGQNLAIFAIFLVENIEKFYFLFFVQKWKKNRFRTKKMTFLPLWPPLWLSHSTLRKNWNGQKSRFCVVFDQIMTQTHSIIGFVPKIYVFEWKWYILTFCRLLGGQIFAEISPFLAKNLLKCQFQTLFVQTTLWNLLIS